MCITALDSTMFNCAEKSLVSGYCHLGSGEGWLAESKNVSISSLKWVLNQHSNAHLQKRGKEENHNEKF